MRPSNYYVSLRTPFHALSVREAKTTIKVAKQRMVSRQRQFEPQEIGSSQGAFWDASCSSVEFCVLVSQVMRMTRRMQRKFHRSVISSTLEDGFWPQPRCCRKPFDLRPRVSQVYVFSEPSGLLGLPKTHMLRGTFMAAPTGKSSFTGPITGRTCRLPDNGPLLRPSPGRFQDSWSLITQSCTGRIQRRIPGRIQRKIQGTYTTLMTNQIHSQLL